MNVDLTICALYAVYIHVCYVKLCQDDAIMIMCLCVLLDKYGVLFYWMTVWDVEYYMYATWLQLDNIYGFDALCTDVYITTSTVLVFKKEE